MSGFWCELVWFCLQLNLILSSPIFYPQNVHFHQLCIFTLQIMFYAIKNSIFDRFSSEEVSAQNQVKASVQRKIRQSIAEEVLY